MTNEGKFLYDLCGFLDCLIDSGHEVHIEDRSDPDHVVEHVFNADDEVDIDIDVDADVDVEIEDELPFDEICEEEHDDCGDCPHFDECYADEIYEEDPPMWGIPDIERVVFNPPATIVFWADGEKTVVRCMEGQPFEQYAGFAAACMKKLFGSTSRAKAIMKELAYEQTPKVKKQKTVAVPDLTEAFNIVSRTAHNEAIQEAVDEALNG